jgi:uncharacterized membrane protein (DUF2068 family)
MAVSNLGRAIVALQYMVRLPDLPLTVSLSYLAGMGAVWGIVFVVCSLGLSSFRHWGRWCTLVAVTLYQANVWVNHLLFDASDYAGQTRPRNLALTATLLLTFWGSLNLPVVRKAFDESGEQA